MEKSRILSLISWNVNGIRAITQKGFYTWLDKTIPDILCLQETRVNESQLDPQLAHPTGYYTYWNSAERKGYSGTALLSREKPISVQFGLDIPEFDREGRSIIAKYSDFTLINCYFPNGGQDNKRVPFKLAFYEAFLQRCEQLRKNGEMVIFCGDLNTAHKAIDLANPESNEKNTGFLPEERDWLDKIVNMGYVDTFRHFFPEAIGQYTWWSFRARARERNVGWRLDYFFVVKEAIHRVTEASILANTFGSDHCPVAINLRTSHKKQASISEENVTYHQSTLF